MKLLIIDDDAVDRMSIAITIHAARVSSEIAEAATALEGLNALTQREFDAVLLDYRLPDMDCLDALHAINRTATHNVAVIVLTGGPAEEELGCRCIEAGAQDFLLKSEVSAQICRKALLHAKTRQGLKLQLLDAHRRLQLLAENDPLTGLANRYCFDNKLATTLERARQQDMRFGILFMDLDNFKLLNDCYGHSAGNMLLKIVAKRLLGALHPGEMAARLGGDEFAIIAQDISGTQDLIDLSARIMKAWKIPSCSTTSSRSSHAASALRPIRSVLGVPLTCAGMPIWRCIRSRTPIGTASISIPSSCRRRCCTGWE